MVHFSSLAPGDARLVCEVRLTNICMGKRCSCVQRSSEQSRCVLENRSSDASWWAEGATPQLLQRVLQACDRQTDKTTQ